MLAVDSLYVLSIRASQGRNHHARTLQDLQRQTKFASPLLPETSLDS